MKSKRVLRKAYQDIHRESIEQSKKGDVRAQYVLYTLYSRAMYNICLRMLNSREDAEDAMQDAFCEIFDKLKTFRYESAFGAWVKRIVVSIHTVANFSQLWMEEVNYDSHMNLKFGSLTIDKVRAGFSGIDIVSEYADLNLHFDADASFKADILHHKDVVFEPPKAKLKTVPESEKISDTEIHSWFRNTSTGDLSEVKIKALQKCYLNMIIN